MILPKPLGAADVALASNPVLPSKLSVTGQVTRGGAVPTYSAFSARMADNQDTDGLSRGNVFSSVRVLDLNI